jgi:glycosyltransferase involved in cell wall biosynthesis
VTVLVVMPALNAARTLEATVAELPAEYHARLLLVDDGSTDETSRVARALGIPVIAHPENRGYGANQKTCYAEALRQRVDVVVMLHPDHQYDATAVPRLVAPIEAGEADIVLGSRLLAGDPRDQGMPWWRYRGNRVLTTCQNRILGLELTDYHSGLRAFRTAALERLPFRENSDDFLFDQQILVQAVSAGLRIREVPARCRYFPEASSISFPRSVRYGLGTLGLLAGFAGGRR